MPEAKPEITESCKSIRPITVNIETSKGTLQKDAGYLSLSFTQVAEALFAAWPGITRVEFLRGDYGTPRVSSK
jgi:hypothetical protein